MEGTSTQMMDASYRTCDACGRVFPTVAGLDIHRRDSNGSRRGGAGCGGLVELPPRSSCKETAASDIAVRQAAAGERQDAMLELLTKTRLGALVPVEHVQELKASLAGDVMRKRQVSRCQPHI